MIRGLASNSGSVFRLASMASTIATSTGMTTPSPLSTARTRPFTLPPLSPCLSLSPSCSSRLAVFSRWEIRRGSALWIGLRSARREHPRRRGAAMARGQRGSSVQLRRVSAWEQRPEGSLAAPPGEGVGAVRQQTGGPRLHREANDPSTFQLQLNALPLGAVTGRASLREGRNTNVRM